MRVTVLNRLSTLCAVVCIASGVRAEQSAADRSDPAVVEEELRQDVPAATTSGEGVLREPEAVAARSALTQPVLVGAILIEGAKTFPQARFAPVVERYAGRMLSADELRALAADVATIARDAGYGLATAWIPEQRLENGLLRVHLEEGRIDAVEVSGEGRAAVQPLLAGLANGKPVRIDQLERQLILAGDLPGIRMGKARLERRNGGNVLIVSAALDPIVGRAGIDNWGSATAGPVRGRVSVDFNDLLAPAHRLTVDGMLTLFQPDEFALLAARYTAPLGTRGTELSVGGYYAKSQAGGELADRDFDGRSTEVEAELRHALHRNRAASLWGSISVRVRDSEQTREDVLVREDRMSLLTGNLYGFRRLASGRIRGRASIVQGVDLFAATERGDPLASRNDADGSFSKLELWGEVERKFKAGFSVVAQAEGQIADGPLLSSEEMGLGGRRFGRAWDYREFGGDRGIAGSIELRRDFRRIAPLINDAQVYAYADAGVVDNYRLGSGGGSLASAGGGVRMWMKHNLRASAEIGLPLSGGSGDSDPRLSFTLDITL